MTIAYDRQTAERHAEMLANRVRKNFKRLKPRFDREKTTAFRLYDRDIPEVRAAVDWYDGHYLLAEFVRTQTAGLPYLEILAEGLRRGLNIPEGHLHLRRRQTRPSDGSERYAGPASGAGKIEVLENGYRFLVNCDDYLDTGLFTDHRLTRMMIRDLAAGKSFLNLFGYTGSFTVYAAAGGALNSATVDASANYLAWAGENLKLNGLADPAKHRLVKAEAGKYVRETGQRWDIILLDPPSFSDRSGPGSLDIQRDHRSLVESTARLLAKDGMLFFSTNHQRFEPELNRLTGLTCEEITSETLPVDYAGRTPHRCFVIRKAADSR